VTIEGRVAQFELDGAVCMEAKEKNGLWGIATAEEKLMAGVWIIDETPWYPKDGVKRVPAQKEAQTESVKENQTEVIEIDLDSDEDGDERRGGKPRNEKMGEPKGAENPPNKEKTGMGARRVTRAAAAEGVGDKEVDLRGSNENEKTLERTGSRRYPERDRRPPGWLRWSEEETI
jgi:hypothetical protein